MLVFVETESGAKFPIEMKSWYTVPDIKQIIESCLRIPVSKQTLSFDGTLLLRDDLYVQPYYNIVEKSRLYVLVRRDHEPNQTNDQALPQTDQPPVPPSDPIVEFLNEELAAMERTSNDDQVVHRTEKSPETFSSIEELLGGEDWPSTTQETSNIQSYLPVTTGEAGINIQDSSGRINSNQDLLQREPSNSYGGFVFGEDRPLSAEHFTNIQDSSGRINSNQDLFQIEPSPPSNSSGGFVYGGDRPLSAEHFTNIQDWSGRNNSNQDLLQREEPYPPSNSFGSFVFGEDQPWSTEHFTNVQSYWPGSATDEIISSNNQVFQTEKSPPWNPTEQQMVNNQDLPVRRNQVQSPPVREVINIPDSPVRAARRDKKPPQKLRVIMFPYSSDGKPVRMFPVDVNANENVEEVRKVLEKLQELDLPKEGYFFIHHQSQRVLEDYQSFRCNGVAYDDTIEIFPGYVTPDNRSTKTRFRTFPQ